MITGNIQAAQKSKSGKTVRLQVNDRWYSSKDFSLESRVGYSITFDPTSSEYPKGSGELIWWLNDYTFTESSAPRPSTQAPTSPTPPTPPTPPIHPDNISYLPMTSNVVAHAITAGLITSPTDISNWARAAFSAAKNLVAHKEPGDDFDDDIPFSFLLPTLLGLSYGAQNLLQMSSGVIA